MSTYKRVGLWGLRRVHGVYATTDRIIVVELGRTYLIILYTPFIIASTIYLRALYFFQGPPPSSSILYILLTSVPILSILFGLILTPALLEKRLEHRRPWRLKKLRRRRILR